MTPQALHPPVVVLAVLVALVALVVDGSNATQLVSPATASSHVAYTHSFLVDTMTHLDDTGCPQAFMGRCSCGMGQYPLSPNLVNAPHKFLVNCTNTNFRNATVLKYLPLETEVLIFTGNTLGALPPNVFNNSKDYDLLDTVDLSNNKITFIAGKSFHKVYSVRTLILNHNDIEISEHEHPRMFYNFESLENLHLTNAFTEKVDSSYYLFSLEVIFFESDLGLLVKLHLEQNEIFTIGKNTSIFCQLPSLEQLYLGDNRLSDLDFKLSCMPDLRYVDLQHNSINQLSAEAMDRIDQFSKKYPLTVELQQNPFMCDCMSQGFIRWLKHINKNITLRDGEKYRCADGIPRSNVGKSLLTLNESLLQCHIREVEGGDYTASTIGTLAFLLAFVTAILLAVAYFHKNKLKKNLIPYWDFITRKIGYKGLANEEVTEVVAV